MCAHLAGFSCKNRLELRKEAAGMRLPFFVSISYESVTDRHVLTFGQIVDKFRQKNPRSTTSRGNNQHRVTKDPVPQRYQ